LGTVIDFLEYFKTQNTTDKSINHMLLIVDHIHPKIEALIADEMAKFKNEDDALRSLFDLSCVTSLSFILAQYLTSLASRPNNVHVTEDNMEVFATNLLCGMIKSK
jgi:hypothetical protein